MSLRIAYDLFSEIRVFVGWGLLPTLNDIWRNPCLLVQPLALRRTLFTHIWAIFSTMMDENGQENKRKLITPHAYGIVLDIGAGHGHTAAYLDRTKVNVYVALEPNTAFHSDIRRIAASHGFTEADGTLRVLSSGAEDTAAIISAVGPVDTIVSVLALCSVPGSKVEDAVDGLVNVVLKPGGQFLVWEHVESPRDHVRRMQNILSPIWMTFFDGCTLGRTTFVWIRLSTEWAETEEWDLQGDENIGEDTLFFHRLGRFVKNM